MRYHTPWNRLYRATVYSLKGLSSALRQEQAFEYEAVVFCVICAVSLSVPVSPWERLALIGAWLVVMSLELINSAVERAFDLIDTGFRPEIGVGKDMLSASVFLMVSFNILLWLAMILRHLGWL